ncbi:MAG: 6-pyruvoyl tetrahydropterin synthase family protein [Clostridiaceae bacterium]
MYILKIEHSFDSAHFLANYVGKCGNIHGHRWRIEVEILAEELVKDGQLEGMVIDFGDLKKDIKEYLDYYDHSLIIQENSMRKELLDLLIEDNFKVIVVPFRTTAENFSKFFYEGISEKGYKVKRVTVYETPTNSAAYESSEG